MAYLLNVTLPKKGNLCSCLRSMYGIGLVRSSKLVSLLGLKPNAKIGDVNQSQLNFLGRIIDKAFMVDYELKRNISSNIMLLKKLKTFRGFRHFTGLPTRGQRTHTNASTHKQISRLNLISSTSTNLNSVTSTKNLGKGKQKVKAKVKQTSKKKK